MKGNQVKKFMAGRMAVSAAIVLTPAVLLAGCTSSSEAPVPAPAQRTRAPDADMTFKDKVDAKIPCDNPIITIVSWFCPTTP